jgi:integrase/recombinase XerD
MIVREVVRGYEAWLQGRLQDSTIAKYKEQLKPFVAWAGERWIEDLTAHEIELDFLTPHRARVGKSAQSARIAVLRGLFRYAIRFDIIERNPMDKLDAPRVEHVMQNWLDEEQAIAFLDACVGPLERAVCFTLRYTGLRVGELRNLRWSDIDLEGQRVTVTQSKTAAGRREVYLPDIVVPILRKWREQQTPASEWVFTTTTGRQISKGYFWVICTRVGERAGLAGSIGPHTLRRTYASNAINKGARIEVVSRALGHANVGTTARAYAQLTNAQVAREIAAVFA